MKGPTLIVVLMCWYIYGVFCGVVGLTYHHANSQPECPTEDSCIADYEDGEWHIIETQP